MTTSPSLGDPSLTAMFLVIGSCFWLMCQTFAALAGSFGLPPLFGYAVATALSGAVVHHTFTSEDPGSVTTENDPLEQAKRSYIEGEIGEEELEDRLEEELDVSPSLEDEG